MTRHPVTTTCLTLALAFIIFKCPPAQLAAESLGSIRTAILLSAATLAEGLILIGIYRLNFHPLAKHPGPLLAALSDCYTVYHCLAGERHIDFYRLHERYGPICRFGPNRISVNTNTALKSVYGIHANTQKSQVYSAFGHFFKVPATMTTIDKKRHAFKRRVTVQALTPSAIKGLEELILNNINFFLQRLGDSDGGDGKEWSTAKDMTKLISWLLADIMGDVTFSQNWDMQRSERNRHIIGLLSMGTCLINMAGHIPSLLALKLDQLFFPKLVAGTHQFKALSKAQSDWRVAQKNLPNRDLFAALIDAKDPQTGLSYKLEELIAEAGILIVAGSDTTATTLTATLFYLLHYPDMLAEVSAGVFQSFRDVDEICMGGQLTSCRFLFACIDEAMRLSPSVGAMLPREILNGGLVVDGVFFPSGVDIGVPGYSIHHNEAYYAEPFKFDPHRWLRSDEEASLARSAFCPFGVGRTSCVGQYLAYQEIGIILARMIWSYEMRLKPGSSLGEGSAGSGYGRTRKDEFQLYDRFTSTHEGPLMEFRRRG